MAGAVSSGQLTMMRHTLPSAGEVAGLVLQRLARVGVDDEGASVVVGASVTGGQEPVKAL